MKYNFAKKIYATFSVVLNSDRNVGHIEKSGTSTQLYKTLATATVWNCMEDTCHFVWNCT